MEPWSFLVGVIVGLSIAAIGQERIYRRAVRRRAWIHTLSLIRSSTVTLPPDPRDMEEAIRLERLTAYTYRRQLMETVYGAVRGI